MKELTAEKKEIIKRHEDKLAEVNQNLMKMLTDAMVDPKTNAQVRLKIGNWLDTGGKLGKSKTMKMSSHDKLEFSKLFFENAKMMVASLNTANESMVSSIDKQLNLYEEELRTIDAELGNAGTPDKRRILEEAKRKNIQSAV